MKLIKQNNFTYVENFNESEYSLLKSALSFSYIDYPSGVTLYEEFLFSNGNNFKFFTGLLPHVLLKLNFEIINIEDQTLNKSFNFDIPENLLDGITLRYDQLSSIRKCMLRTRGIVDLPTRTGKTEIFCGVSRLYQDNVSSEKKILILEEEIGLMEQTAKRLTSRGVKNVGLLGDSRKDYDKQVIVCTIDTLYNSFKKDQNSEFFSTIGGIIVDECHHLSANSYKSLVSNFNDLDLLLGFSGTPLEDRDNPYKSPRDAAIIGCLHSTIVRISPQYFIDLGVISEPNVFFIPYDFHKQKFVIKNYNTVYNRFIVNNLNRNLIATHIIRYCYPKNLSVLISVTRISHGKEILKMLNMIEDVVFSYGGNTNISLYSKELHSRYQNEIKEIKIDEETNQNYIYYNDNFNLMKEINEKRIRVLIGSSIFDEGRDIPSLDGIILLAGGSSHVKSVQRPARALTKNSTRNKSFIIDFEDKVHPYLKSHSNTRKKLYEENCYNIYYGIADFIKFLNSL